MRSLDSVVDIATRYGLDGVGIGSWYGKDFRTRPEAQPASYTMGTGSFPGVKRPGRGVDRPLHLAPKLKKSRPIPLLPSGPSWPVLG
jgi:hypothetical protein